VGDVHKDIVRRGYDATAARFAAARGAGAEQPWLRRLIAALAPGAAVLDLGCGNGVPVAKALAEAGLAVTGVDFSTEQARRAVENVPAATIVVADMAEVDFEPGRFDGAIAWDSIFHLPAAEHAALFARVCRWLRPGAPFVLTAGGGAGELHEEHLGAPTYYASLAPPDTLARLSDAGFDVLEHVLDEPDGHGHLVIWARARSATPRR
jgi:SAM-dependent methyltransferase